MLNYHSSLRKSSFYLMIGALLRSAISFVSVPLLIRWLGLERYGIWIVLTSLSMLGGLFEFGLTTAISKHISEDNARADWAAMERNLGTSFFLTTLLGLVAFSGLLVFAPYLSELFFHRSPYLEDARLSLEIMAVLLFLYFWQHWLTAVQGGLMRYDLQAAVDTVGSFATTLGSLLIAMIGGSLSLLASWSILVTACSLIVYGSFLKRLLPQHKMRFRLSWNAARILLRFGSMQWWANLGSSLFAYLDRIVVNYFLGPSAVGIYAATTAVVLKINHLSAMPLQALPAWISTASALSQKNRVRQIFLRATRLNGLVVFLIAAPIMFWAQPFARFLVGAADSEAASQLLLHLSLIYGLYSLAGAGFYTAIGIGSPGINAIAGVASGLLVILALATLTPALGLGGAVLGNALYILVLTTNLKVKSLINLGMKEYILHFMPAVVALLVWWSVSLFLYHSEWTMTIKTPVFIVTGAVAAVLVGGWRFWREMANTPLGIVMK